MRIVVLSGLPGSGKSTWLKEQGLTALSSDAARSLLTDDITNQNVNRLVFSTLRQLCTARLAAGAEVTYIDSTALTPWERRCWIRFAELHDCAIECVYFDVPLEVCKSRNTGRERIVPDEAMDRMAAKLVPPSESEGFASVRVIRA